MACGEASTQYSTSPYIARSAQRIYETIPDAKLIYIMRHPVDRLYSHYQWEVRMLREDHGALLDTELIPTDTDGFFVQEESNAWKPWKFAPSFERSLEASPEFFLETSAYLGLELVLRSRLGEPARREVEERAFPEGLTSDERERLLEYFRPANEALGALFDRDLSDWGR